MTTFRRGLSDPFVTALNVHYRSRGWLAAAFDDDELFVALRDEYLNVYYQGQSLARVTLQGGALVAETHYKYLLRDDVQPEYVRLTGGAFAPPAAPVLHSVADWSALKRAARAWVGEEKRGVERILRANPNVLDVEVAISDDSRADRIDLLALRDEGAGAELVFVEAKTFANPELRAAPGRPVPVLEQIGRYTTLLVKYEADLRRSYLRVSENLLALDGAALARRHPAARTALTAGSALRVSSEPRLAIYGFDQDQKDGAVWAGHRVRLEQVLGKRLLLRGDPDGFTRGISR
jgi:hypothetical protein